MRIVAIVIGALLLVAAVPSALTGCGVVAGVGDGSRFTFPVANDKAPDEAAAVVVPEIDLTGVSIPSWIADTSITLEVIEMPTVPMFIGIASAGDVAAYVDDATVAEVDLVEDAGSSIQADRDGVMVTYTLTNGTRTSLPPPADEDFWIRESADGRITVSLADLDGRRTALVLMREDGRPGIVVDVDGTLRAPLLRTVGLVLFIGGLIGSAVGIALILIGVLRKGDSEPPAEPAVAASPPPSTPDTAGGEPAVDTGPPSTAPPAVDTRPLV